MENLNVNLEQFEGMSYDPNNSASYVELWAPYFEGMELSDDQKVELAKAWQCLTIDYLKNKDMIEKKYPRYEVVAYAIFGDIVKSGKVDVDWEFAIEQLKRVYPPRPFALGMLAKHKTPMASNIEAHFAKHMMRQIVKALERH